MLAGFEALTSLTVCPGKEGMNLINPDSYLFIPNSIKERHFIGAPRLGYLMAILRLLALDKEELFPGLHLMTVELSNKDDKIARNLLNR